MVATRPAAGGVQLVGRDNVNYNVTAMLAALDSAAHSKDLLANYYRRVSHPGKGLDEAPYGFFLIPADQGDPARRGAREPAARTEDRSRRGDRADRAEGRQLAGRHLRRAAGPAVSQLRGGPAHRAALSRRR